MTGLFEVALKNVPALQDSVNQHEMASAGMLGEEAPEAQAESFQDNLRRMDAGSNAQASTGLGIRDLAWDSAFRRRQLCARRTEA